MADNPNNNKRISASSFLGNDRYDQYIQELSAQGTIAGKQLSSSERKEAFKKRNNKVAFKTFVEKVLQKKAVATARVRPIGIKALPAAGGALAKIVPQSEAKTTSFAIVKALNSILATLNNQLKFDKKTDADDKKEEENEKRKKRESALEGIKKIGKRVVDKLIAPFKSIFDRIWNFIFFTLLGRAFTQLMNWLGDPKNADKVKTLGRFLKDWWPALLGLYFMPFKGFMLKTLGRIAWFAGKFALRNPGTIVGTIAGEFLGKQAVKFGKNLRAEREQKRQTYERAITGENYETSVSGKPTQITAYKPERYKEGFGGIFGLIKSGFGSAFSMGGLVNPNTGLRITGAGADTQLTALQPGEIVMNRAAVRAIGAEKLLALNSMHGGTNANKPRFANNIQFAQSGGMVGYGGDEVAAFMRVYNLAKKHGAKFPELQAAIAMKETGWLRNMHGNNAFNQRGTSGKFLNYKNLGEAVKHNVRLWDRHREGMSNFSDFKDPVSAWNANAAAYAPPHENDTEKYKADVAKMMRQMRPIYSQSTKTKTKPRVNFFQNILGVLGGKKQGGGLIGESTGYNIPGGTADRQLTALEPGEYVLPADTVNKLGVSLIDKLVALTDSNSNPTKLGMRNRRYMPTPLSRGGRGGVMTLAPITQSTASNAPIAAGGTQVPSFSATSPMSDRGTIADIYGIV